MKLDKYKTLEELVELNIPKGITIRGYFHKQILHMVNQSLTAGLDISESDLIEKIQNLDYGHTSSSPSDDDEYMEVTNPFNQEQWEYATCPGCAWPTTPTYRHTPDK